MVYCPLLLWGKKLGGLYSLDPFLLGIVQSMKLALVFNLDFLWVHVNCHARLHGYMSIVQWIFAM